MQRGDSYTVDMPVKATHEERLIVTPRQTGIREVCMVGRYWYRAAQPPLRPHTHDALEVCLLTRGEQVFNVGDRAWQMRAGDVFFTRPGETHSTGLYPSSPGCLYWIQFRPPGRKTPYLGLSHRNAMILFQRLEHLPDRHFHGGAELERLFTCIFALVARPHTPLLKDNLRNLFLRLLFDVSGLANHPAAQHLSPGTQRALAFIEAHTDRALTISELARAAGVSESHFKTAFRREIGLPPVEYALRQRIARARELLLMTDSPITTLGFDLGFSTSQHFATVFRKFVGFTPRDYRRRGMEHTVSPVAHGTGASFHPVGIPRPTAR